MSKCNRLGCPRCDPEGLEEPQEQGDEDYEYHLWREANREYERQILQEIIDVDIQKRY